MKTVRNENKIADKNIKCICKDAEYPDLISVAKICHKAANMDHQTP